MLWIGAHVPSSPGLPCRCGALSSHPYIYMRWKEMFFVNTQEECGLTIAGHYYVCMSRKTGQVTGFYYDAASSPFQKLVLAPMKEPECGHAFGRYRLWKD